MPLVLFLRFRSLFYSSKVKGDGQTNHLINRPTDTSTRLETNEWTDWYYVSYDLVFYGSFLVSLKAPVQSDYRLSRSLSPCVRCGLFRQRKVLKGRFRHLSARSSHVWCSWCYFVLSLPSQKYNLCVTDALWDKTGSFWDIESFTFPQVWQRVCE